MQDGGEYGHAVVLYCVPNTTTHHNTNPADSKTTTVAVHSKKETVSHADTAKKKADRRFRMMLLVPRHMEVPNNNSVKSVNPPTSAVTRGQMRRRDAYPFHSHPTPFYAGGRPVSRFCARGARLPRGIHSAGGDLVRGRETVELDEHRD